MSCPAGQTVCTDRCVDTQTDRAHCGACGNVCSNPSQATGVCVNGRCGYVCNAGFADCNLMGTDGCEVNVTNNPVHCGRCGNVCPTAPNAVASCAGGRCTLACTTGFADCNGNAADGCETNITGDRANCGACGRVCPGNQVCVSGSCWVPSSCQELHLAAPSLPTGLYDIQPPGVGSPFTVQCEMARHGGGWTLIGSFVNGVPRSWTSLAVLTDTTTFGTASTATSANFKSPAWSTLPANDLLIVTAEYDFGFRNLLGNRSFGSYIAVNWPGSCNRTWTRSGVDFATGLTLSQQRMLGFTLRAHDDNASCFPEGNENAAVVFLAGRCCWVNGLANTPMGWAAWGTHDHSLLRLSYLVPSSCTAGIYPCNGNGLALNADLWGGSNCNDMSCKAPYALVYVR